MFNRPTRTAAMLAGAMLLTAGCAPVAISTCTTTADCADGETCSDGTCVVPQTCTTTAECGDGEVCSDSICVEGCTTTADCGADQICVDQVCIAGPVVDIGITDDDGNFVPIADQAVMPFFRGNQGGSHIFPSFRATGFPFVTNGRVNIEIEERVSREENGAQLTSFRQITQFIELEDGTVELQRRFVFMDASPASLEGTRVNLEFIFTADEDETYTTTVRRTVELQQTQ